MSIAEKFCWERIDDEQFEELVFKALSSINPEAITWRKGSGDQGRDIQMIFQRQGALGEAINETYFVEVKHYKGGVPPSAFMGALSWAQAEQPQVLLIAVSSHLTTPCREYINAWQRNNSKIRVIVWERKEIENEILKNSLARELSISLGLLPPYIQDLLPANPQEFRANLAYSGFALEYRYWITVEEVEKLGYIIALLERLKCLLIDADESFRHHEEVCIAIPSWSIFLTVLQSQLRLQISIRDYLFGLNSELTTEELSLLSNRVKECVEEVRQAGDLAIGLD